MKIGIIGEGNTGASLARKLAASGHSGEAGGLEGA